MPILSEDVIIRLLVDTQKGVSELKKTDRSLKSLMSNAVAMGAAMGGVSIAIELAVKLVTQYVQKLQAASTAYMKLARESGDYYSEAITAVDDLTAAEERLATARAKAADERLAGLRQWRAESKDNKAFLIENAELIEHFQNKILDGGGDISYAWERAIEEAKEYIKVVSTYDAVDNFTGGQEALAEAGERANQMLKDQASLLEKWLTADAAADSALISLRHRTELLGLAGADLLEVQRAQALELIKLNQFYADHQVELTAATNAYFDQALAVMAVNEQLEKTGKLWKMTGSLAEESVDTTLQGWNQLGSALNGFLSAAFGETKGAAISSAIINTALAITNALANIPPPFSFIAAGLMSAAGAAQIATISSQQFALGTPAGSGYTVPPGYENDTAPIYAKSGETVHVDRPGSDGGQMINNILTIDGYQFGMAMTRAFKDRKATVPADVVIS